MVALLSPETLGERQRWRELGCGRLRRCGVAAFLCLVVLLDFCRCTSPNSPNCRPPCTNVICPSTPAPCVNGTYELCNGCCTACAAGLGQLCDSHGNLEPPCGDGLTCARGSRHYPGICERLPNASDATPSPSPSPSATTPTAADSVATPTPEPTAEPTPDDCSGSNMTAGCRPACTVDFCSETETRKKRICSAKGLSPAVPERNECLHTSCGACFLLREPDCSGFVCPEPPTKDCLRRFYTCIRDHYFGASASSNLIPLEDHRARTTPGRVVCLVPSVDQHTHGSSDSTSTENGST